MNEEETEVLQRNDVNADNERIESTAQFVLTQTVASIETNNEQTATIQLECTYSREPNKIGKREPGRRQDPLLDPKLRKELKLKCEKQLWNETVYIRHHLFKRGSGAFAKRRIKVALLDVVVLKINIKIINYDYRNSKYNYSTIYIKYHAIFFVKSSKSIIELNFTHI